MSVRCQILNHDDMWKVSYTPLIKEGCRAEMPEIELKLKSGKERKCITHYSLLFHKSTELVIHSLTNSTC